MPSPSVPSAASTASAPADPWPAPHHDGPVDVDVELPGSKSQTNRALVLGALADGPSVLRRPLRSRDTELMAAALRALGARVDDGPDDAWTVTPTTFAHLGSDASVDCGLAGTVMRFVPPVAALAHGRVRLDGDPRARERPMDVVVGALRDLGVRIEDDGRAALPFTVAGTGVVRGGIVTVDASASSQFVSALLLAGARYDEGVDVRHVGKPVPSAPHVEMTLTELRRRGVEVETEANRWSVRPGPVGALDHAIEPDLSNAGAFVAAALVTGGTVRVHGWPCSTDQAGHRWQELAALFGADATLSDETLHVRASGRPAAIDVDLHDEGELTPVVAAVCAVADGPSRLHGIAHLRGHETDRLAAIAAEVNRLGGEVRELDDGLEIRPGTLRGTVLQTYEDHRMAHAAAVLGLAVPDVQVHDVATTAKTFPGFAAYWERVFA